MMVAIRRNRITSPTRSSTPSPIVPNRPPFGQLPHLGLPTFRRFLGPRYSSAPCQHGSFFRFAAMTSVIARGRDGFSLSSSRQVLLPSQHDFDLKIVFGRLLFDAPQLAGCRGRIAFARRAHKVARARRGRCRNTRPGVSRGKLHGSIGAPRKSKLLGRRTRTGALPHAASHPCLRQTEAGVHAGRIRSADFKVVFP